MVASRCSDGLSGLRGSVTSAFDGRTEAMANVPLHIWKYAEDRLSGERELMIT
jgi:hypothetical protein